MALDVEPIYTALLALIAGATTWGQTPSRRMRDLKQLGVAEQPTAYLVGGEQQIVDHKRGLPAKWHVKALLIIYARTDDVTVSPGQVLNPIKLAVEKALEQQPSQGGIMPGAPGVLGLQNVLHCYLDKVELLEGLDTGQGVLMADVNVLAVAV